MTTIIKYSLSHEWIQINEKKATVGITEYARKELGEIVYVELPVVGSKISFGEEVVVLESTKAAADIYSPSSGEVIEVNTLLQSDLTSLNNDPEGKGWLFKMTFSGVKEEESLLLDRKQYEEMVKG